MLKKPLPNKSPLLAIITMLDRGSGDLSVGNKNTQKKRCPSLVSSFRRL